jgi:hypothetical protein
MSFLVCTLRIICGSDFIGLRRDWIILAGAGLALEGDAGLGEECPLTIGVGEVSREALDELELGA